MSLPPVISRTSENRADLRLTQQILMMARLHKNDWHDDHAGELMRDFFMDTYRLKPQDHISLWYGRPGRLAAYAILGKVVSTSFHVLPHCVGAGIVGKPCYSAGFGPTLPMAG